MRLSNDRFSKTTLFKRFQFKDNAPVDTLYQRHTYETHNAIYDVDVRESDGNKTYHVNMGFDVYPQIHAIHKAIEKHFNL